LTGNTTTAAAIIAPGERYDRTNEINFREEVRRRDKQNYKRNRDLIVPPGMKLAFTGANGEVVVFGLDGDGVFTIKVNDDPVIEIATDGQIGSILSLLANSIAFTVDGNGRAASFKLLSDGATSNIAFKADAFDFFDGVTERALFSAAAGVVTVRGDVQVGGSIAVGAARLKVALESIEFSKSDGETIQWAGGTSIGSAPQYSLDISALNPLASGEAYDVRLTSVTNTGATVRAKILTPGTTAAQSETTDSAGGGGAPDRVMHKPTSADAYNAIYNFTVSGTIDTVSFFDSELDVYFNSGGMEFSTWFNDGGGWDEGPTLLALPPFVTEDDITGPYAFEGTVAVEWSAAIGQHGGEEFGISHEGGGSVTDLDEVAYTTQTSSGERTASPNGEKVKIVAFPRNA
jgi:hypothetical protein